MSKIRLGLDLDTNILQKLGHCQHLQFLGIKEQSGREKINVLNKYSS